MFYNYVKILYSILENYKADSNEFSKMLEINNDLINKYKKQKQHIQQNKHAQLKTNQYIKIEQHGGTNPITQLEALKNEIISNLQNLESKEKSIELQKILNKIIEYIKLLDELLQKSNLGILSKQLQEMNEILKTI